MKSFRFWSQGTTVYLSLWSGYNFTLAEATDEGTAQLVVEALNARASGGQDLERLLEQAKTRAEGSEHQWSALAVGVADALDMQYNIVVPDDKAIIAEAHKQHMEARRSSYLYERAIKLQSLLKSLMREVGEDNHPYVQQELERMGEWT